MHEDFQNFRLSDKNQQLKKKKTLHLRSGNQFPLKWINDWLIFICTRYVFFNSQPFLSLLQNLIVVQPSLGLIINITC